MASPLDNHLETVLAARKAGKSFATIAGELEKAHGITVGKRGLSAWYRRRQRRMRELRSELEDFGCGGSVPEAAIAALPIPASPPARPAAAAPDDDWTVPSRPSRIELKVVRSSQES